MSNLFGETILDEAQNPANFGKLIKADLIKTSYNSSCGDLINITIKLSPDKTEIKNIKWTGSGCTISLATMSLLSKKLLGMKIKQVRQLTAEDLLDLLKIEDISPGRLKCLMIGLKTAQSVI